MANSKGPEVNSAKSALDKMKMEIATELGIPNYDSIDKGNLPARVHGKIGGNMVKRMISSYEAMMSDPNNHLMEQSNPVSDAQLDQDKQVVKNLLS